MGVSSNVFHCGYLLLVTISGILVVTQSTIFNTWCMHLLTTSDKQVIYGHRGGDEDNSDFGLHEFIILMTDILNYGNTMGSG